MPARFATRFTRRQALTVLTLLPADYVIAASCQPPATQGSADLVFRVALIGEVAKLLEAKKFADAVKLVEARQKALGTGVTKDEKKALLTALAFVYFFWGEEETAQYQYQEAIAHYQSAYAIDKIYRPDNAALSLYYIGYVYSLLGEKTKALNFYQQALPLWRQFGDKSGEAETLNNIGRVYVVLGELSKALDFYNQALHLQRQVDNTSSKANTLNNIGFVYSILGERTKALDFYAQALSLQHQIGDIQGEARTLNNIGLIYQNSGEPMKSLDYYKQVLSLVRQVGDRQIEASALNNIGGVYQNSGEPMKSLDYYKQALSLARQLGDKSVEAITLSNVGWIYSVLGEPGKTLDFYNQALTLLHQLGDKAGEASTARNLMYLFSHAVPPLSNLPLAVTFGKQSVNLYQTLRGNIQNLDKALQTTFTKSVEPAYRELADILIGLGRLPEAQQVLDRLKSREFADFTRPDTVLPQGNLHTDLTPREADAKKRYDDAGNKINVLANAFDTLKRTLRLEPTEDNKRRLAELENQLGTAQAEFGRVLAATIAEFQAAKPGDARDRLQTVPETKNLSATLAMLSTQTKQNTVAVYTLVSPERLHHLVFTPQSLTAKSTTIKDSDLGTLAADFRAALETPHLDPRPYGKKLYDLLIAPIEADLKGASAQQILWSLDGVLRYVPLAALSPDGTTYLVEQSQRHSLFTPGALPNLTADAKANWSAAAFGVTQGRPENGIIFKPLDNVAAEIKAVGQTVPTHALLDDAFTEQALRAELRARPPLVHISSHFAFLEYDPPSSFLLLGKGILTLDSIANTTGRLFGGVDLLTLSACDTATGGTASGNGKEVDSLAFLAQQQGAGAVMASLWPVSDASTQALMQTFYALHKANPGLGKGECLRQAQVALLRGQVALTGLLNVTGAVKSGTKGRRSPEIAAPVGSVPFQPVPTAPCAHPFYWAAFTLIGNTK